jgi:predicted DNA-binding transcriptional regulator YafY
LHAPLETLAKKIPSSAGLLEVIDQNSCMLRTGAHSVEGIAMHLSWLGVDFQVHEPDELIAHVRKLAERLRIATS